MAKMYKGYEDSVEIDLSEKPGEVAVPVVYRTLFIGLGGTGGEVLNKLSKMMSDEEKERAHIIYLDMDSKDVTRLRAKGMNAVSISSADTVVNVMNYLGRNDGVRDWLPHSNANLEFLSSKTDDGASQFRMKSRLCLARYLKDNAGELKTLLDEICTPGRMLATETLRVMIVSSVAGGTGAGTFIQMALYLREYFRSNGHRDISITGLFACPDLFVRASDVTDAKKENMYANAYAAVRELNAMNLAVNLPPNVRKNEGYGKNINIAINTKSEGALFDSNDPNTSKNANNKPYNLLYFIDVNNTDGGLLRSLDQYYDMMADIVYTRLYSPIEPALRSDESNELSIHAKYPTAIYGSAGYGRIIYPYHGVMKYLAVRKTAEELDHTWSLLDNEWTKYKRIKQKIAAASGVHWAETTQERGKKYISDMQIHAERPNGSLRVYRGMIRDGEQVQDRAELFVEMLMSAMKSGDGISEDSSQQDSAFGLSQEEEVNKAQARLKSIFFNLNEGRDKKKSAQAALEILEKQSLLADVAVEEYANALNRNLLGRAVVIASQVVPRNEEDAVAAAKDKSPLNLFYGLLSIDGAAVHPVAARYLLYRVREQMQAIMEPKNGFENTKSPSIELLRSELRLVLDTDRNDGVDVTVEKRVEALRNSYSLFRGADIRTAVKRYSDKLQSVVHSLTSYASDRLRDEVFNQVLAVINKLIAQYEGLFDNLDQYKDRLRIMVEQEAVSHESATDNRCIYVNASRRSKEYLYAGDLRTREILDKSGEEINAAAGLGVYNALMTRTWKLLQDEEARAITGYEYSDEEDKFNDLGGVFSKIISIYREYLEENATHLKGSVVYAMVSEICQRLNISRTSLSNPVNRVRLQTEFGAFIQDMINKAKPMLNFNVENEDTYFEGENSSGKISTIVYKNLGMSPAQRADLCEIYGGTNPSAAEEQFEKAFRLGRGAIVSDELSDYEMICFQAVHCLQPTQIYKFHEDNGNGYYPYYKERLQALANDRKLSESPHLDKRWHLREAMPYISRTMEQRWIRKTAKAFVNELLSENFKFTTDSDGVVCFTYRRKDSNNDVYVYWPEEKLVTLNDISRLVEFLQEHDARVEENCAELDITIENVSEFVSKYADNMSTYKRALTNNPILIALRGNLLRRRTMLSTSSMAHGKNRSTADTDTSFGISSEVAHILGVEDKDVKLDMDNSKGGILNIAWLIHKSEERQRRDNDFGEAILNAVQEIIETLCKNMFREDITKESDEYAEYRDLYNSIMEKFVESFVLRIVASLKMLDPELLKNASTVKYYRYLNIPKVVTETQEFQWLERCWKLKK